MKQKYLEEEDFALLKVSQKEQFPKKKRHISLKSILKEIGFSKNHLYSIIAIFISFIAKEPCFINFNIFAPVFYKIYKKDNKSYFIPIISGIFFIGYIIGNLSVGRICEKIGRRKGCLFGIICMFILSLISVIDCNPYLFLICRLLFGICFGIAVPQIFVNFFEIIPDEWYKSYIFFTIFIFERIGSVYFFLSYNFLSDEKGLGNWRFAYSLACFPLLLTLFFFYNFYHDSTNLLIQKGEIKKLVDSLNSMRISKNMEKLSEDEIEILKKESKKINMQKESNDFSYLLLFSKEYYKKTILLTLIVAMADMSSYTNLYSSPILFEKLGGESKNQIIELLKTQLYPIFTIIILIFYSKYFGKYITILTGFVICALTSVFPVFSPTNFNTLVTSSIFINCFIIFSGCQTRILVIEEYPTKLRDIALATIYAITKITISLTPSTASVLMDNYPNGAFIQIGGFCMIGMIAILLLSMEKHL